MAILQKMNFLALAIMKSRGQGITRQLPPLLVEGKPVERPRLAEEVIRKELLNIPILQALHIQQVSLNSLSWRGLLQKKRRTISRSPRAVPDLISQIMKRNFPMARVCHANISRYHACCARRHRRRLCSNQTNCARNKDQYVSYYGQPRPFCKLAKAEPRG